jgi:DNA-directed RNA polymerase specialized sigma24 family protein
MSEPGLAGCHTVAAVDLADDARTAVASLYRVHAVGLIRLAVVTLGDRAAAEDVVQEAFCGLYRRHRQLAEPEKALCVRC